MPAPSRDQSTRIVHTEDGRGNWAQTLPTLGRPTKPDLSAMHVVALWGFVAGHKEPVSGGGSLKASARPNPTMSVPPGGGPVGRLCPYVKSPSGSINPHIRTETPTRAGDWRARGTAVAWAIGTTCRGWRGSGWVPEAPSCLKAVRGRRGRRGAAQRRTSEPCAHVGGGPRVRQRSAHGPDRERSPHASTMPHRPQRSRRQHAGSAAHHG